MSSLQILKRALVRGLLTLWIVISVIFFSIRLIPGGPFDSEIALSPEVRQTLEERYYLNRPLPQQYYHFVKGVLRFDFGSSTRYQNDYPIVKIVIDGLIVSGAIGSIAFFLACLGSLLAAVVTVSYPHGYVAWVLNIATRFGVSVPSFIFGAAMIYIFSERFKLLPPALLQGPSSYILPSLTLAYRPFSILYRALRESISKELNQKYVRTAFGKGLSIENVVFIHILPNAALSLLGLFGILFSHLVTGSFVIENMFALPGLGKYFVTSILDRDYALIIMTFSVYAVILIFINQVSEFISDRWLAGEK